MNKKLIYIAFLLLAVFGMQSCDGDMAQPPISYPEQKGTGAGNDPYNVGAALVAIYSGNYTTKKVYVRGIVSQIDSFEPSYGNMTYYISNDGSTTNALEVYRGLGLNGQRFTSEDELKVGDEVVIYCQLTYYNNSVAETNQGAIIVAYGDDPYDYSEPVDPIGNGSLDEPFNVTKALEVILAGNSPQEKVYVKGIVSQIDNIDTSYGNATYYISDDGKPFDQLEIYRGYSLGGAKFKSTTEIKVGDEVIVYGQVVLFNSTPEFTTGSQIYSLNGQTGDVPSSGGSTAEPQGDGTQASPYNVAKAQELISSNAYTSDAVYIEGTISEIKEVDTGNYGNATYFISDDGTKAGQLEVYRGYYLDGAKFTAADQIKVGDKVVIQGVLTLYNTTPEVTQGSKIVSINGAGNGGGGEVTPPASGDQIYSGLTANADGWTIDNGTLPEGVSYVWQWDTKYTCLKGSAYVNSTNYATSAYAYRAFDLSGYKSASAAFEHCYRFGADTEKSLTLVVRQQGATEWTVLKIPTWNDGTSFTFVNSGSIDLAAYAGKKIEIGFHYTSTSSASATWEVKNFTLNASK